LIEITKHLLIRLKLTSSEKITSAPSFYLYIPFFLQVDHKNLLCTPLSTKLHPFYHLNSTQPNHTMWQSPPFKSGQPYADTCHNPPLTKLTNQILPRHHLPKWNPNPNFPPLLPSPWQPPSALHHSHRQPPPAQHHHCNNSSNLLATIALVHFLRNELVTATTPTTATTRTITMTECSSDPWQWKLDHCSMSHQPSAQQP